MISGFFKRLEFWKFYQDWKAESNITSTIDYSDGTLFNSYMNKLKPIKTFYETLDIQIFK